MKLLVDELPGWRGDCPFAEEKWENHAWTYICKLKGEYCNLNEAITECLMLKEANINES